MLPYLLELGQLLLLELLQGMFSLLVATVDWHVILPHFYQEFCNYVLPTEVPFWEYLLDFPHQAPIKPLTSLDRLPMCELNRTSDN